ncbi:hypothetical protein ACFYYM_25175 [Streptomyces erythrochromogenes]|uniref:hypothetical protein n=1 Tax=Streptomyces erythrochromogenes TaxID=285574 RepID=UPI00367524CD
MSRVWRNTPHGIKDFERSLSKGMTVYAVNEHSTAIAAQFERYTYSAHTCTGRHVLTGAWMFNTVSAKYLLCGSANGRVYENPPPGLRDLAGPDTDCRDEGSTGYRGLGPGQIFRGRLDLAEIERMEGHAQDAEDEFQKEKAKRGKWF